MPVVPLLLLKEMTAGQIKLAALFAAAVAVVLTQQVQQEPQAVTVVQVKQTG